MDTAGEEYHITIIRLHHIAGLSNPYVEVKVGMEIVYRSKVIKHTLNPEWLEHVSLSMPSADEVITVVTIFVVNYIQWEA